MVDLYLARRKTPVFLAGKWQLLGLGLGAVLAGSFSGWAFGLITAGYDGFWVSIGLSIIMYVNLALCLAELACAIPVVGGITAFCRAVFGNIAGYFIGYVELFGYLGFMAFLVLTLSQLITDQTGLNTHLWPLLWIFMLIPLYILMSYYNSLSWKTMLTLSLVCMVQLFAFILYAMRYADETYIYKDWPEDTDMHWGKGLIGIISSIFSTAWFFTGFECIVHATKETDKPIKNIPFVLIVCSITFCILAVAITYFNCTIAPGGGVVSGALFPILEAMDAATGYKHRYAWEWMLYPTTILNLITATWTASRQVWALARVGYMPQLFAVVPSHGTPARAIGVSCVLTYVILFILYRFIEAGKLAIDRVEVIYTDIVLLCAFAAYACTAITYIGFSLFFPNAPRPFKNPFGIYSAGLLMFIAVSASLVKIMTDGHIAIIAILIFFGLNSFYFFVLQGMHLVPTEESMMQQFWAEYRDY
jgi:ethanolamine permease